MSVVDVGGYRAIVSIPVWPGASPVCMGLSDNLSKQFLCVLDLDQGGLASRLGELHPLASQYYEPSLTGSPDSQVGTRNTEQLLHHFLIPAFRCLKFRDRALIVFIELIELTVPHSDERDVCLRHCSKQGYSRERIRIHKYHPTSLPLASLPQLLR